MKSTFKVLFYLKRNAENKDGEVMIMARVTLSPQPVVTRWRFVSVFRTSRNSPVTMATRKNTVGNVFSGQVVDETAKTLSERFGKVLQQRQPMTINRNDKSTSISTQMDSLIPTSKISNLTQSMFVGAVSDNFDERIEQRNRGG